MKNTKTILFRLSMICVITFFITCEEQVFDNPHDAEAVLNPNEWSPTNLNAWVISDSEIKLNWAQEEVRISGFRIDRQANYESFTQIAEVGADKSEYRDTGLNSGTDYTYRVKAFTDYIESSYDTSNTTNTSFPSPTNLVAIPISDSEIELTWTDNCGFEDGFRLERSTDGSNFEQIAEIGENVTDYTDRNVILETAYQYRVKAFTEYNESGYTTSNTTNTSFPSPTDLVATPISDSEIQITWNDNCNFEIGYKVERSEDGFNFTQNAEVDADVIEYTDTGLDYGTDYNYRVKAFTVLNESGYATSNTTNTSLPSPSNLSANPIDDQSIQLTWIDNCSFESGYRIERLENGSNFSQIAEVGENITEYTDTGLNYGTDYTYRVMAYTDDNESDNVETTVNFWMDCNSEWGGLAFENVCDNCVGGNTGLVENDCGMVTDIDGNEYRIIIIGDQYWMAENLKVTHYRNGDPIQHITSDTEWKNISSGAYCNYSNDENNLETYGRLYNLYAMNDNRNITPEGWHVSTNDEWQELVDYLGGSSIAGGKLKEAGTVHWNSPNTGATNESEFTALPGGYRTSDGIYYSMGNNGTFWSSTDGGSSNPWYRALAYHSPEVYQGTSSQKNGLSIRCIRD